MINIVDANSNKLQVYIEGETKMLVIDLPISDETVEKLYKFLKSFGFNVKLEKMKGGDVDGCG